MSTRRCAEKVWDKWRWNQCRNKATQGEYCGIHRLEAVAKRQAKRDARTTEKATQYLERAADYQRQQDLLAACEQLGIRTADQLRERVK